MLLLINKQAKAIELLINDFMIKDFLRFVDIKGPNECWEWKGGKRYGYGKYKPGRTMYLAHRVSYHFASSRQLLPGELVLHKCNNRGCVNPAHLKAGTCAENLFPLRRTSQSLVRALPHHIDKIGELCKHGHLITRDNIYITTAGYFACKTCLRGYSAKYYRRKRCSC